MQRPIDEHTALIFTMVLISAAEGEMTDAELDMIGRQVRYLPVFRGFDHQRLTEVGRDCADLLRDEDGLETAVEMNRVQERGGGLNRAVWRMRAMPKRSPAALRAS